MENDILKEVVKNSVLEYAFRKSVDGLTCTNYGIYFGLKSTYNKIKDPVFTFPASKQDKLTDLFIEEMRTVDLNGSFKDISRVLSFDDWLNLIRHIRHLNKTIDLFEQQDNSLSINLKLLEEIVGRNIATILQKEMSLKWLSVLMIRPKYFWCHFRSKTLTAIILTGTISGIINTIINVMSHLK
jgi:hypothetical protein